MLRLLLREGLELRRSTEGGKCEVSHPDQEEIYDAGSLCPDRSVSRSCRRKKGVICSIAQYPRLLPGMTLLLTARDPRILQL